MEEDITNVPRASSLDVAYHAVKIVLGAAGQVAGLAFGVPVAVPAADFFATLLDPPLSKRKDEWVRLIATKLVELDERIGGLNLEALQENERFVSAFLEASNIAARTHHMEKLEALANAVIRSAASGSADDDTSHMFMHLVDRVTPSHMSLLGYFDDKFRWAPVGR